MTYIHETLGKEIDNDEFLYRGIIEKFWDYSNNRPSSAAFKDSKGISVDRQGLRDEKLCVEKLIEKRNFFAVSKIKTEVVRNLNAIVIYLPVDNNLYHSEIHDSIDRVKLRGSKPKKLRDSSTTVSID